MTLPSFETLTLTLDNHIAEVGLNRPDKANAMNLAMWTEIQTCFEWLDAEPEVRVVILHGEGKNFCAGIDLAMFGDLISKDLEASRANEKFRRFVLQLQGNLTSIELCRKPVIAAIHRNCIGGGIDMVTCADMRYCTEDVNFSIKEIDIGMTADVGTLQRLPTIVSEPLVREWAFTGRNIKADEAKSANLVNAIHADKASMMAAVRAIAADITEKSPLAIRGTKEMLNYGRDHSVADGLNYIATWNAGMLSEVDVMAAITASSQAKVAEFDD